MKNGTVVFISTENVTVSDFTIRNSGHYNRAGVFISADGTHIYGNNIVNNAYGVIIQGKYNNISYNLIDNQQRIDEDTNGIWLWDGNNNSIWENIIQNNGIGVVADASHTHIFYNTISRNDWGLVCTRVKMETGGFNEVHYNNFMLNKIHASFIWEYGIPALDIINIANWNRNYWEKWKFPFPKPIIGFVIIYPYAPAYFPWLNFDYMPLIKPYNKT